MDALAGLPFRVVAIPGLVEGGYPGVLRPDPFLLDAEREALGVTPASEPAIPPRDLRTPRPPSARPRPGPPLLRARPPSQRAPPRPRGRLFFPSPRPAARTGRERM